MNNSRPLLARFDEFELDEANARLARAGRPVDLPPKAFAVLCTLVGNSGRLVAKNALLDAVWGHQHISESVLKTTISQVRAALADDAKQPRFIETASRRGYRFIAALAAATSGAPGAFAAETIGVVTSKATAAASSNAPAGAESAPPPLAPVGTLIGVLSSAATADGLVGRSREIAFLASRLYLASDGSRRVVFVAGEPGIGKTTLIERFVAAQSGAPLTVATGQCIEHFGASEPYMPVLEALNVLARGTGGQSGDALVALMRRVAPTWLVQLPWYVTDADRGQLQREVAGATQDRMLREFGELMDRFTKQHPLLLVLEDLHWSDHATVQLLGYLARKKSGARLLVVGSFRPTEIVVTEHPLKTLRQELRLHRLCEEIDLEAFAESDVADYLARRFDGQSFPETFVRALHAHTEGLPLFVVNVVDELMAEGRIRRGADGEWAAPDADGLGIPENIVGVVERQLSRLPEDERQWLVVASVVGAEFVHTHVADALGIASEPVHEALDRCARRGDWVRAIGVATLHDGRIGSRYAFRHALYRHVLYLGAGEAQRMQLHRRVADALIRCYCTGTTEIAAELALHYERAGDIPLAVQQLQTAAVRALGRFAAKEAAQAAQHALRLLLALPDAGQRLDAELELRVIEGVALAHLHLFSAPEVAAAFERAETLCDALPESPARARALHGLWWVNFGRGEMRRALALARRIANLGETTGDPNLQIIGCIATGSTLTHMGDFVEAQRILERGYAIFQADAQRLTPSLFVHDPGVELLSYLGVVSWWRGEPDRARETSAASLARALEIRHGVSQIMAMHFAGVLYLHDGRYEDARRIAAEGMAIVDRLALAGDGPTAHAWVHGAARVAQGDVDEGLAEMRRAAEAWTRRGMLVGLTGFYFLYGEACLTAGRYDEARQAAEDGLALARDGAEHILVAPLHRVLAVVRMQGGDHAGAAVALDEAITISRRQGARCFELAALLTWVQLPQIARRDAAAALRTAIEGYGPGDALPLRRARAALAELDAAPAERGSAPGRASSRR